MTLSDMAADEHQWHALRALILSEQVPVECVIELGRHNPKFAEWFKESMEMVRAQADAESANRVLSS